MSDERSPLDMAMQVASAPLKAPLWAGRAVSRAGRDAERYARGAIAQTGEEALLAVVNVAVTALTDERVMDRVLERFMDERVIDRVLERAEAAGVAQRVADRILEDGIAEQIAERALSGPELERIVAAAFRSALPDTV